MTKIPEQSNLKKERCIYLVAFRPLWWERHDGNMCQRVTTFWQIRSQGDLKRINQRYFLKDLLLVIYFRWPGPSSWSLHKIPKQHCQLGTRCSDTWVCKGYFKFKSHHIYSQVFSACKGIELYKMYVPKGRNLRCLEICLKADIFIYTLYLV